MRLKIAGIVLVFLITVCGASATTVKLAATSGNGKDKYCQGVCHNTNELIFSTNAQNRVYVMFDLSGIPAEADISTAQLLFKYKTDPPSSYQFAEIYPCATGWNEDDSQQPGALDDSLIGRFNTIDCGSVCDDEDDWFGVRGEELVFVVEDWISDDYPNNGFLVNESQEIFTAHSSESATGPFLYLEYEVSCYDVDNDGFGTSGCAGPLDCNDSDPLVNPNATEICNHIDDDCNDQIDDVAGGCKTCAELDGEICNLSEYCAKEFVHAIDTDSCCPETCMPACLDGAVERCGTDVGACSTGYRLCNDNVWSECRNETGPSEEICNNIDDNCDGIIDNTTDYEKCQCYNGSLPSAEIYDGIDNDCDNTTDEGWDCTTRGGYICILNSICPGILLNVTDTDRCCSKVCVVECEGNATRICGTDVGVCRAGTIRCVNGNWTECQGESPPGNETCNREDDDCNGIVDDIAGFRTVPDTKCQCVRDGQPYDELCNEIDDDCDGNIDESCTTIAAACSDGIKNYGEEEIDCGGECSSCGGDDDDDDDDDTNETTETCMVSGDLDTDCDGMPDYWEDLYHGVDKNIDDADDDSDKDGYDNYEEYINNLDPDVPNVDDPVEEETPFNPLVIGLASLVFVIVGAVIYLVFHRQSQKTTISPQRHAPVYPSKYHPRKHVYIGNSGKLRDKADKIRMRIDEKFR